jgi:hypothetical protein
MLERFQVPEQHIKHRRCIAGDRQLGKDVFVDLRGVDIDVNDTGIRRKIVPFARDTVREPGSDGDQQVALVVA